MSKSSTNTASNPVIAAKAGFDLGHFVRTYMIVGVLILFVVALAIMTKGNSIAPVNLVNVIRQVSAIGIIGVGMTFVIITLGIDLSVGSILGLSAVVAASLAQDPTGSLVKFQGIDVPVIVAILAGLGVGANCRSLAPCSTRAAKPWPCHGCGSRNNSWAEGLVG